MLSLEKPNLYARFRKASILPDWPTEANTPHAGNAYSTRDTIKPTKMVLKWKNIMIIIIKNARVLAYTS